MEVKSGCLICGADLVYAKEEIEIKCSLCGDKYKTEVFCKEKHFICDNCHSDSANAYIEKEVFNSNITNPIDLASELMTNKLIQMHGPEHHFLVPAVLLAAYSNITNNKAELANKLKKARSRAGKVLGGFCGTHGTCGAAMGVGIFISLITETTPLSEKTWMLSNLASSKALEAIALNGGPRCCKRDTYIAIMKTVEFLDQHFNVKLEVPKKVICNFYKVNKECTYADCIYFE